MIALPISYSFKVAAALIGQPWSFKAGEDGVDKTLFQYLTSCAFKRVGAIWHAAQWPQLRVSKRRFRLNSVYHFSTVYGVNAQVYHPPTDKCFISIDPVNPGQTPPETPTKWAELKSETPIVTDDPTQAFSVGDRVYGGDGWTYYCKVDGATYGEIPGGKFYRMPEWDPAFPLLDSVQGNMGAVLGVHDGDPKAKCTEALRYELIGDTVRVEGDPGSAWFTWRLPQPIIGGAPFDLERAYQAGEKLYYETDFGGDYYDVLQPTAAGDTPTNKGTSFAIIRIPQDFSEFLGEALSADWLRWDGQQEKAPGAEARAAIALNLAKGRVARQQRQEPQMTVTSR